MRPRVDIPTKNSNEGVRVMADRTVEMLMSNV